MLLLLIIFLIYIMFLFLTSNLNGQMNENSIEYINHALEWIYVEVVAYYKNNFYLGHDELF